ncbi:MAG: SixA phosphatase family protein [Hyphomicrobium sp.]
MLTLALFRHAKSSWDDPALDDFDRPLNARGQAAAPRMGQAMAELGVRPSLILCSPAARTRETLERAAIPFDAKRTRVVFDERLYLASAFELLRIVREAPPSVTSALVIGHNPGLQTFALNLTGQGGGAGIGRMTDKFPTAALALLAFDVGTWPEIRPGEGRLEAFITPKERA